MRVVLDRAGNRAEVEVSSDLTSVTVGGRTHAVVVVAAQPNKVELEIDGEKVVVENWPDHFPVPFGPVDVNGERWSVTVEVTSGEMRSGPVADRPVGTGGAGDATPPPSMGASASGEGVPVLPSMPGRVIELRVADGDRVTKGQTLLVLEAMKMRGEVTSPADGIVRDIRVAPGANARAKEPMLWIRPDPKVG